MTSQYLSKQVCSTCHRLAAIPMATGVAQIGRLASVWGGSTWGIPSKSWHHIASWLQHAPHYRPILHSLGAGHFCHKQTDRQTDVLAIWHEIMIMLVAIVETLPNNNKKAHQLVRFGATLRRSRFQTLKLFRAPPTGEPTNMGTCRITVNCGRRGHSICWLAFLHSSHYYKKSAGRNNFIVVSVPYKSHTAIQLDTNTNLHRVFFTIFFVVNLYN